MVFLKKECVTAVLNAAIDDVDEGQVVLADGAKHEFAYAMTCHPSWVRT